MFGSEIELLLYELRVTCSSKAYYLKITFPRLSPEKSYYLNLDLAGWHRPWLGQPGPDAGWGDQRSDPGKPVFVGPGVGCLGP